MADELRMALAEVLRKAGVEQAVFYARGYGSWPTNSWRWSSLNTAHTHRARPAWFGA
jgi:hypothetical protein